MFIAAHRVGHWEYMFLSCDSRCRVVDRTEEDIGFLAGVCDTCRYCSHSLGNAW